MIAGLVFVMETVRPINRQGNINGWMTILGLNIRSKSQRAIGLTRHVMRKLRNIKHEQVLARIVIGHILYH